MPRRSSACFRSRALRAGSRTVTRAWTRADLWLLAEGRSGWARGFSLQNNIAIQVDDGATLPRSEHVGGARGSVRNRCGLSSLVACSAPIAVLSVGEGADG